MDGRDPRHPVRPDVHRRTGTRTPVAKGAMTGSMPVAAPLRNTGIAASGRPGNRNPRTKPVSPGACENHPHYVLPAGRLRPPVSAFPRTPAPGRGRIPRMPSPALPATLPGAAPGANDPATIAGGRRNRGRTPAAGTHAPRSRGARRPADRFRRVSEDRAPNDPGERNLPRARATGSTVLLKAALFHPPRAMNPAGRASVRSKP